MKPYICLLYTLVILFWGLRPFNFRSTNGVDWLKAEKGIYFHDFGIVYGPAELNNSDQPPLLGRNESISIELWLTPGEDDRRGFSYIFCLYDDQQPELFSLSQVKSLLNLSKYQNPEKNRNASHNWRWVNNALPKARKRFLTIISDKNHTTVYLDGKKVREFRNYSLAPETKSTPQYHVVIGNDPSGRKPWTGKIHGLAIYNHALSPGKVFEHFEKWRTDSVLSLLSEKEIIALYPMDEQKGHLIHNALNNRYNLLIPDRFIILKKEFLKLYGSNLTLNDKNLRDIRNNILGFIPLGYFFIMAINFSSHPLRRSTWRLIIPAILGGIVVSLIIETLQVYLPTRYSSIRDLIFNTFGAGLGVILAVLFIKIKKPAHRTRQSAS